MEQHVKDEIAKQLDYYVDAYRKVRDLDMRLAQLSEEMSAIGAERGEAEVLRNHAQEALDAITVDLPEEDEAEVKSLVSEHLQPLIGLMVL